MPLRFKGLTSLVMAYSF